MTLLRGPWPDSQEKAKLQREFQDIVDDELREALRKQGDTDEEVRRRIRAWKLKRWGKATMFCLLAWLGLK